MNLDRDMEWGNPEDSWFPFDVLSNLPQNGTRESHPGKQGTQYQYGAFPCSPYQAYHVQVSGAGTAHMSAPPKDAPLPDFMAQSSKQGEGPVFPFVLSTITHHSRRVSLASVVLTGTVGNPASLQKVLYS